MIIQTKLLQDNCKKILDAVDTSVSSTVAETLELEGRGQTLYLNVTNKEYYVSISIKLDTVVDLYAVVDAKLFLNLISKITTSEIELTTTETTLNIKANGKYKIPLIYDDTGNVISLPKIIINNVTNEFNIDGDILQSIWKYNTKELLKSGCVKQVQKLFYIDECGALTFTNGACVNSFTLEQPVTLFLTEKIIKLFKLFKHNVSFAIGQDIIGEKVFTKVSFSDDEVSLVSILNNDSNITNTFPVKPIRELANNTMPYNINVDKDKILESLNRLLLFTKKSDTPKTYISFGVDGLTIYDSNKENHEFVSYNNSSLNLNEEGDYLASFYTQDLKVTLETCSEQYINISFGNHRAIIVSRGPIKNIIAECGQ